MGFSRLEYPYSGGDQLFPVNFALGYLSQSDITAYVVGEFDGFGNQVLRAYTWEGGSIRLTDPLPDPSVVFVDRTINKDALVLDVSGTSAFTRETLVRGFQQLMMIVHELLDGRVEEFSDIVLIKSLVTSALEAADSAVLTQAEAEALLNAATTVAAAVDAANAAAQADINALTVTFNAAQSTFDTAVADAAVSILKAAEALASASTATTQAGIATTQATQAAGSASTANTHRVNAGTSETNAAASAVVASTQAGISTTKASEAAGSAQTALDAAATLTREIYVSTAAPTGGADGDIWFQY